MSSQGVSANTLDQLEVVDLLETTFNGNTSSEHASTLEQFEELAVAYSSLGDMYLADGLVDESVHAKERSIMLTDESLGLLRKKQYDASTQALLRSKQEMLVERFANLAYLCKDWQHLSQARKYYMASTAKARDAYGQDSVDYLIALVPYCALLMDIASSDEADEEDVAGASQVLELLSRTSLATMEKELGADHEATQEAHQIVQYAEQYHQARNLSQDLLLGAMFGDEDDDVDLPLPDSPAPPVPSVPSDWVRSGSSQEARDRTQQTTLTPVEVQLNIIDAMEEEEMINPEQLSIAYMELSKLYHQIGDDICAQEAVRDSHILDKISHNNSITPNFGTPRKDWKKEQAHAHANQTTFPVPSERPMSSVAEKSDIITPVRSNSPDSLVLTVPISSNDKDGDNNEPDKINVSTHASMSSPDAMSLTEGSLNGGQSISTLGQRSAVTFDDGGATVMSEYYKGGKASSKAAVAIGAFGGTHNDMLALIREKADADAGSGDDERGKVGNGGGGADSNYKEGVMSLHTVSSRVPERIHSCEVVHDSGDKLEYSVEYLHLNPDQPELLDFFKRHNEKAYAEKVGEKLIMPLFPAQLKEGGKYSGASVTMSRYVMCVRIQRLFLQSEIDDMANKITEWTDLKALCIKKKEAHAVKMRLLEDEIGHAADDRNTNGAKTSRPISNFSCFLTTRDGWKVVTDLLHREVRRLQNPEHNLAGTEEINEGLGVKDCQELWELLHWWQLFYSAQVRARVGLKHYPVRAREEKRVKKDEYALSDDEGSENGEVTKKKKKKKEKKSQKEKEKDKQKLLEADKAMEAGMAAATQEGEVTEKLSIQSPVTIPAMNDAGIEAHLNKINLASELAEMAQVESVEGSVVPDFGDDSTIASQDHSLSSVVPVAEDDDISLNSTPSIQDTSVKPKEAKKSSSWGLGNMFGAGEVVEEVVEPEEELVHLVSQITTNNGVGVCEWSEVCKLLGCSATPELTDITLLGACKAILELLNSHCKPQNGEEEGSQKAAGFGVLKSCCTRIDINDLMMGINELLPLDQTNPWVESVMIKLSNNIAQVVQSRFMDSLRLYEKWQKCLENMKKDRIKKEGGSMKEDVEGTTEVDKQGQIRIIPHSDQIVDTDIVHGNKQRLQISVVMPVLEVKLAKILEERSSLEGELACCIQFGYIMVAPTLQRVIRGTRGRMRRNLRRYDSAYYSMHMATVTLQTWIRGILGRKAYAAKKEAMMGNIFEAMAVMCQKSIRMFNHSNKYRRYVREKKAASEWFALTSFQAMIRGFNARHKTAKIKAANAEAKAEEIQDWSVRLIQRWVRGCYSRGTIIRSLKVRKTLSKDVLLMGEKYLQRGDLWGFLKIVDDKFSVLNNEIKQNQQKEDEFAATFVNKVLAKRQGDFDGAWDRFSKVTDSNTKLKLGKTDNPDILSALGETSKESWGPSGSTKGTASGSRMGAGTGGSGMGGPGSMQGTDISKAGSTTGSTKGKGGKSKKVNTALIASHPKTKAMGPGHDTDVPGPLLRRAVSATVQEGVTREKKSQRIDVDPMDYPGSHKQQAAEAALMVNNKKAGVKMVNGKPVRNKPKKGEAPPKGKIYATTTDWAWANATGTVGAKPPSPIPEPRKVQPGESLLVDIPKGLDDQLERLLHVVSLKTYIPEFCNAQTCEEAYELYLRMPKGLAKMRYEIEAHKWCQPQINKLRVKGIHTIRDALPMNKFRQYLNSVETPMVVVGMATQWVRMLVAMGDVPSGKIHMDSIVKQGQVRDGVGTIGQLKNVGLPSPDKSLVSTAVKAIKLADGTTVYQSTEPNSESSSIAEDGTVMVNGVAVEVKHSFGGEETAGKVLLHLVEGGEWANLHASAEDLLLHAAFLVVPHSTVRVDKFGTHEDFSEMGHLAFKAHTRALQFMNSEDERREAVRKRFRAALLLSTPFSLRLKAGGIRTVHDLIEKAEMVVQLKLPPQMQTQVESMLSTAVGSAVSAKQAPTIRNHCDTAATTFTVPMIYDNKFQRGPFDPYGKPPRFIQPANLKSNKDRKARKTGNGNAPMSLIKSTGSGLTTTKSLPVGETKGGDAAEEEEDSDDEAHDLDGRGLWERKENREKTSNTIKNAKKLYSLQTTSMHVSQEEKDEEEALRKELKRREEEGNVVVEDEYDVLEREAAKIRESTAAKRARLLMHDFEARVRAGFERPFKCRFEGCSQAFSRAYTLKIHEKSHKLFGNYHQWKRDPQLFLDKDKESMASEAYELAESRTMLPPIVRDDIQLLKDTAAAKAYEMAFNTGSSYQYGDLYGKLKTLGVDTDESEKALSMKIDACRWPAKRTTAGQQALNELPPSRGESRENTPSIYERPFSGDNSMDGGVHLHQNWGVGANKDMRGQEVALSRKSQRKAAALGVRVLSPVAKQDKDFPQQAFEGIVQSISKPGSPTKSILKVRSASSSKRAVSPSHDILRSRLEKARAESPMFRALASREKLTSKGNIPSVDSLRNLSVRGFEEISAGSGYGSGSVSYDGGYTGTDGVVNLDGSFAQHWATSDLGTSNMSTFTLQSVDFQALSADSPFMRPGTGMSRPGTVESIEEEGEEEHASIRFGNSLIDDDDNKAVDPFDQPYDDAYA